MPAAASALAPERGRPSNAAFSLPALIFAVRPRWWPEAVKAGGVVEQRRIAARTHRRPGSRPRGLRWQRVGVLGPVAQSLEVDLEGGAGGVELASLIMRNGRGKGVDQGAQLVAPSLKGHLVDDAGGLRSSMKDSTSTSLLALSVPPVETRVDDGVTDRSAGQLHRAIELMRSTYTLSAKCWRAVSVYLKCRGCKDPA